MHYEYELVKLHKGLQFTAYFVSIGFRGFHWHMETEIMWVLKGSVILQSRQGEVLLEKGDLYFLNSYEIHSLRSTSEDNLLLGIQLGQNLLQGTFHSMNDLYFKDNRLIASDWSSPVIRKYMAQMMIELTNPSPTHLIKAQGYLYQLVAFLLDHISYEVHDQNSALLKEHDFERITKIIGFMKENFSESITLDQLAQLLSISRYHVSHFIKAKLGIGFQELLNQMRLEHAILRLMQSNEAIQSISEKCGFSDVKYLNQMMKRTYHLTAKQFRLRSLESYVVDPKSIEGGHRQVNELDAMSMIKQYLEEKK
ncbi:MAG: helix-turn-helix transcriptional regulator [Vallitaleaceae bacterium]|nr:helix-turn-helix transcriptional regulator [Vallitaleaceae bacterium]